VVGLGFAADKLQVSVRARNLRLMLSRKNFSAMLQVLRVAANFSCKAPRRLGPFCEGEVAIYAMKEV
jgi:hypothetical protein